MACQQFGKGGIEQAGVTRAAAVVHQPRNRRDAERMQPRQAFVMPAPVALVGMLRRDRFPQDRIAQRLDAERGNGIKIGDAVGVAGLGKLIAEIVAHAGNGTFDATPQFQRNAVGGKSVSIRIFHSHRVKGDKEPEWRRTPVHFRQAYQDCRNDA
jgi:hypothetical protein